MSELISIPIHNFRDIWKVFPLDIYYWVSNQQYDKLVEKNKRIDLQKLSQFFSAGMKQLYIHEADKDAFDEFMANSPGKIIVKEDLTLEKRQEAFLAILEHSYYHCKEVKVIDKTETARLSTAFKMAISNNGKDEFIPLIVYVLKNSPTGEIFFRHALNTCAYTYALVKEAGKDSLNNMRILLLAAFVHDFGRFLLPEEMTFKYQVTNDNDKKAFENHPILSVDVIDHMISFSSIETTKCIKQHKERIDGTGYPYKLKSELIYQLTKFLSIADYFSELTLGIVDGVYHPHQEALNILKTERKSFDNEFVDLFINMISAKLYKNDEAKAA